MKIPLLYGLAMAVAGAVLTLVLFFAGVHNTAEKLQLGQWVGSLGGIAIGITTLTLAMREKRATFPPDEEWGYGNAVGVGILTALFGSVFSTLFAFVYFNVINPGMSETMLDAQLLALEAKRLSASQIEAAEKIMRKWMTPTMLTLMQMVVGFFWSVLLTLVIAIFVRRRVPAQAAAVHASTV